MTSCCFQVICHDYEESIDREKQQRMFRHCMLVDCFAPHPLKNKDADLAGLKIMAKKTGLTEYFIQNLFVFVLVCDFPGQYYIRKLVILYLGDPSVLSFIIISLLGPLYLSLNSREMVVLKYMDVIWRELYAWVFGPTKKLAKKPKPWRISLILTIAQGGWQAVRRPILNFFLNIIDPEIQLLVQILDNLVPLALDVYATLFRSGNFEGYLHAVLRLTTELFNPQKRKNYNKISPAFIADVISWKGFNEDHPLRKLYNYLDKHLVHFNDWYPEGYHSLFRKHITPDADAEAVHLAARMLCRKIFTRWTKFFGCVWKDDQVFVHSKANPSSSRPVWLGDFSGG
eukprot:Pompholyxophrys_punicea_v1_NODE_39_length_4727_cov_10.240848.p1 type:complete len:342 gc:universal NODE_39_length_4727_cov_10.240848:2560-1535(-)